MNKVSDRPGLGAEPVPVGAKLHATLTFCVTLLAALFQFFISIFSPAEEEERACRLGPYHLQTSCAQSHVCTV